MCIIFISFQSNVCLLFNVFIATVCSCPILARIESDKEADCTFYDLSPFIVRIGSSTPVYIIIDLCSQTINGVISVAVDFEFPLSFTLTKILTSLCLTTAAASHILTTFVCPSKNIFFQRNFHAQVVLGVNLFHLLVLNY